MRLMGQPTIPCFVAYCYTPETVKAPPSARIFSSTSASMFRRALRRSMIITVAILGSHRLPRSLHAQIPATLAPASCFAELSLLDSYLS